MTLQLFGFRDRPHDFAVTKAGVPLEDCVFLLDFSRRLKRLRWLGMVNSWIGPTVGLLVPVVHQGEGDSGGYVIGIRASQPYFVDIPVLWRKHYGSRRTIRCDPAEPLQIIADFARHFAEDCQPVKK